MYNKKIREEKYIPIPKIYSQWIQKNLPNKMIKDTLYGLYIDENYAIYCDQDKTNEKALVYQASNEKEAKLWLFEEVANQIGQKLELQHRMIEQLKWRYVWDEKKTTPGHVVLKEHKVYKYNVEYDSRKWWMEYTLKCLKPVCEKEYYHQKVEKYLGLMNLWFEQPHWTFDYDKEEFLEI